MHYNVIKQTNKRYLEELSNTWHEFPVFSEAINILQNTEWVINKEIYDVLQHCKENQQSIGNCPVKMSEDDFRECPKHDSKDDPEFKRWKREKNLHYTKIKKNNSKWVQFTLIMHEAKRFLNRSFFYPFQYDFRTRIYPKPSMLSPQSADYARALLKFKMGKPMGTDNAFACFAIAGANLHGEVDKEPLEIRVAWADANKEKIIAQAKDPLNETWWREADKPYCFLAWCFEFKAFADTDYDPDFITTLPIQMDCSNSGLQHYSAMTRDEFGAKATNLIPSEKPQDIYRDVAEVVMEKLKVIKETGDDNNKLYAAEWLEYGVDRKICKKPVMCLPYSLTKFTMRQYVEEHVIKEFEERNISYKFKDLFKATLFLTSIIWDSINEVIKGAKATMGFLKSIANLASSENLPVNWTTPLGVPIQMYNLKRKSKRVKTQMGDTIIKLAIASDTNKVDRRRQSQSICANFVHSLDASVMQLTIVEAAKQGIDALSMIHDSFGTVAPDVPKLSGIVRDSFVQIYQKDVLADFARQLKQMLSEKNKKKFPTLPEKGNLDLEVVRNSDYFCV